MSVMRANNESGVLQDIAALAGEARRVPGLLFHTDAVQALGKTGVDFRALGVHGLTVSAHKIGGPLGAGALILDKRVELAPLVAGGGQERQLRSGTENVMAIVGFGAACALAAAHQSGHEAHMIGLRARLEQGLRAAGALIFAAEARRLPNTSFFALPGVEGETLVARLDRAGFAVASGSACSSAHPQASTTLLAMGVAPELARSVLRVSLGTGNTEQEVDGFLAALLSTVRQLRNLTAMAGVAEAL
jgi:cysteine desulfurase